jgi:hypothetical protein
MESTLADYIMVVFQVTISPVPHYYPALLKPNNYMVEGCTHDDIDPASLGGCSPQLYHENLLYLL